jgi:hypothetical protein
MEYKYKTKWGFADRQNIDKSFLEMLQNAMEHTVLFRNKQLFFQYVILLYMGGKRRIEPFLMPVTITKGDNEKTKYYEIKCALAKHFSGTAVRCSQCSQIFKTMKQWKTHAESEGHEGYSHYGEREYIETYIITDNVYEHALMQYLLQGRQRMTIDFTPLLPPKFREVDPEKLMSMEYESSLFSGITKKFKMFKLPITDGKKVIENTNIVPHMLRHMRAYDAKIIHKYSNSFIQKMFGWNRETMVEYYTDIKAMLGKEAMLEEIMQHKATQPLMVGR